MKHCSGAQTIAMPVQTEQIETRPGDGKVALIDELFIYTSRIIHIGPIWVKTGQNGRARPHKLANLR